MANLPGKIQYKVLLFYHQQADLPALICDVEETYAVLIDTFKKITIAFVLNLRKQRLNIFMFDLQRTNKCRKAFFQSPGRIRRNLSHQSVCSL